MKYHEAAEYVKEIEKLNETIKKVNNRKELIDVIQDKNIYGVITIPGEYEIRIPMNYLKIALDEYKKDMDERMRVLMANFD